MHISELFRKPDSVRTVRGSLFGNEAEIKGEWKGEPGERHEFVLTLKSRIPLSEGYFVAIYKFEDENGNDLTNFASKDYDWLVVGQTYRVKATVKRLTVWEGRKQTQIIRLKNFGMVMGEPESEWKDLKGSELWESL